MLQRFHCEHVLEELGGCGTYQRRLLVIILVPLGLLAAFQSSLLYNQLIPDHWCAVPELRNFSYGEQHRLIRPKVPSTGSISSLYPEDAVQQPTILSQCEMYDIDYRKTIVGLEVTHGAVINRKGKKSSFDDEDYDEDESEEGEQESDEQPHTIPLPVIPTKACSHGWMYNRDQFHSSAAMHFNFVCSNRDGWDTILLYRSLSSAIIGPIHAFIGDKFGRRSCLAILLLTYLASGVSPLLITDYRAFLACQIVNASAYPAMIFLLFVYGAEFMLPEWRSAVILLVCIALHLGEWLAFLMAAILSDWVLITTINSALVVPGILILLLWMDETPHWIISRTRNAKKLRESFEKLNRINGGNLDSDSIKSIVTKFTKTGLSKTSIELEDDTEELPQMTKLRLFLKRSSMIQIVLLFAFVFATNLVVTNELSSKRRKFDETSLVMDSFFGSLIKMPAIFLTWTMIEQRIGRRWSNVTILSVNAFTILALEVLKSSGLLRKMPQWTEMTGTMFSLMLAECSIVIIVLILLEMSPSRFRLLTMALTYSLAKLAALGMDQVFEYPPFQILLTREVRRLIVVLMLGLSILIASFTAETRNEYLPSGLMAAEELMTNVHYWSMSKKKTDLAPSNLFLALSKWDINSNHSIVPAHSNNTQQKHIQFDKSMSGS